jgi:hypothetical protein
MSDQAKLSTVSPSEFVDCLQQTSVRLNHPIDWYFPPFVANALAFGDSVSYGTSIQITVSVIDTA